MKRRKRRRTMRPPVETVDQLHMNGFQLSHKLCVNGVCALNQPRSLSIPRVFSDRDRAEHLQCSTDGLVVNYDGPCTQENPAASVRTDNPIPTAGIALYYFEITVIDQGEKSRIGIGLCGIDVKLEKMPGWEKGSYAYHGDDGRLFKQNGEEGKSYGPTYGTGDVIGCCWDLVDNEVFFTKNGKHLGTAFSDISGVLYPTVGMQSMGGCIKSNFGGEPFTFDIEAYAQQQREKVLHSVVSHELPQDYRIPSDIVLSYLIHNGYSKTASSFAKDAGREDVFIKQQQSMLMRQAICEKVTAGNIDSAIADLEKHFPQVLKNQLNVLFLLRTQKFIEMVVSGKSLEETVEYGRKELSIFRDKEYVLQPAEKSEKTIGRNDQSVPCSVILEDVYLLLAYSNPAESPTGHLTKQSRREMVADRLNSAILVSQGQPMSSLLQRFISQSDNILKHLVKMGNGQTALVSTQDMLL